MPLDELPDALVLVNPQIKENTFPFKEICGAQVAWYLVASLKDELALKEYNLGKFTDFLADIGGIFNIVVIRTRTYIFTFV